MAKMMNHLLCSCLSSDHTQVLFETTGVLHNYFHEEISLTLIPKLDQGITIEEKYI